MYYIPFVMNDISGSMLEDICHFMSYRFSEGTGIQIHVNICIRTNAHKLYWHTTECICIVYMYSRIHINICTYICRHRLGLYAFTVFKPFLKAHE